MSQISIVIPTFNGEYYLQKLLDKIEQQTIAPHKEIIIVDSGSSDQTLHLAKLHNANIVSIPQSEFNHGATRNLGIKHAQGEYIFLFTQDAIPHETTFFEQMLDSMNHYQSAGVYARQVPRDDASPLVKRDVARWVSGSANRRVQHVPNWQSFLRLSPMQRYLSCVFDNVASLIRRDVWEKIPFPSTPFGEDIEWAFRALCNGYSIVYEPNAVVSHSHERSVKYAYQRTLVDHWRLFHLFGLRTIPTRSHLCSSIGKTILNDFSYLLTNPNMSYKWWKNFYNVPCHAYMTALGQYYGAKMAASGKEISQSKEV